MGKPCIGCGETKPHDAYSRYWKPKQQKWYEEPRCKKCRSAIRYKKRNPHVRRKPANAVVIHDPGPGAFPKGACFGKDDVERLLDNCYFNEGTILLQQGERVTVKLNSDKMMLVKEKGLDTEP